jgi:hypothetical protein
MDRNEICNRIIDASKNVNKSIRFIIKFFDFFNLDRKYGKTGNRSAGGK